MRTPFSLWWSTDTKIVLQIIFCKDFTRRKKIGKKWWHETERCYLETVRRLDVIAHRVHLLFVDALNLPQSLSHLILPELAVLGGRVAVRQRSQLLHLLHQCIGPTPLSRFVVDSLDNKSYNILTCWDTLHFCRPSMWCELVPYKYNVLCICCRRSICCTACCTASLVYNIATTTRNKWRLALASPAMGHWRTCPPRLPASYFGDHSLYRLWRVMRTVFCPVERFLAIGSADCHWIVESIQKQRDFCAIFINFWPIFVIFLPTVFLRE